MNNALLDLWYDLREKKLWPVAALLLLAVVAVPVVLKKDAEVPAAPPAATADASAPAALSEPAVTGEQDPTPDSDLGVFDPRNPFKKVPTTDSSSSSGSAGGGESTQAGGEKPSSGGGGGELPASGGSPQGGGTPGTSPGSGGGGKAPSSGGGDSGEKETYAYTVDVEFGRRDSERKRNLERLEFLPSSRQPLVIFMGVSSDRKSAVFLVDSSLEQTGEGTCKPSTRDCSFVYLTVEDDQDEHFLADKETGAEYRLELLAIKKVSTKVLAARSKRMRKAHRARAARLKKKEPRPFSFRPLFADEQG